MRPEKLAPFVLRVFLWMVPCFAGWYAMAAYHAAVAGWLSHLMIDALEPGMVKAVERSAGDLVFVTRIAAQSAAGAGMLLVEVGPHVYTYGLALFLALMLASRAPSWALAAGAIALLPFQAWGIAFDFLAQVAVKLGAEVAAQSGLSAARREAIVFGYQAGSLILPPLAPVVLWAAFNRRFLEALLRFPSRTPAA